MVEINQPPQQQRLARNSKFQIQKLESFACLSNERNKTLISVSSHAGSAPDLHIFSYTGMQNVGTSWRCSLNVSLFKRFHSVYICY